MVLRAPQIQHKIKQIIASAAQGKLALYRIRRLVVPLPPLTEQIRIVERTNSLLTWSESCEEQLKSIQSDSETLTQSLMNKAITTLPNEVAG